MSTSSTQTDPTHPAILVVDPNPDQRRTLKARLSPVDFEEIHVAETGQKALDVLDQESIGVVLFPKEFPNADALQFARRVDQLHDVVLVALCDGVDADELLALVEHGVDECVVQPIRPNELRARMREILRSAKPDRFKAEW